MKKLFLVAVCALCALAACSKKEHEYFGSMNGVVTNSLTGEPVPGASVVLSPSGASKITGSDGSFEFVDLTPQQYTFTVQKNGFTTNRKTVTVVVDENVNANITLTENQ